MADGSLWSQLDELDRQALRDAGTIVSKRRDTWLFFEGEPSESVILIRRGSVKISMSTVEGQEVLLAVLTEGDVVGELSTMDGGPRSATASVLVDAELLVVSRRRFEEVVDEHPEILRSLVASIASRMRTASRRQLEFGTADAMTRVCRRLVEMVDLYGTATDAGSIRISSPLTQTDIAAWAGLSRDSVVRTLRGLRALGWIDNSASRLQVLDIDAIRDRATAVS